MDNLKELQKTVTMNLSYYQACKLIGLLKNDIQENDKFLSNSNYMVEMDNLNPNIRKNMMYSVKCAKDLLNQFEMIQSQI